MNRPKKKILTPEQFWDKKGSGDVWQFSKEYAEYLARERGVQLMLHATKMVDSKQNIKDLYKYYDKFINQINKESDEQNNKVQSMG